MDHRHPQPREDGHRAFDGPRDLRRHRNYHRRHRVRRRRSIIVQTEDLWPTAHPDRNRRNLDRGTSHVTVRARPRLNRRHATQRFRCNVGDPRQHRRGARPRLAAARPADPTPRPSPSLTRLIPAAPVLWIPVALRDRAEGGLWQVLADPPEWWPEDAIVLPAVINDASPQGAEAIARPDQGTGPGTVLDL